MKQSLTVLIDRIFDLMASGDDPLVKRAMLWLWLRLLEVEAEKDGHRKGAQACREMIASFVEQGGDVITATSIRANWNPSWGADPGRPAP